MTSHRFVDRDMLMRYHWGLGVGHLYAHTHTPPSNQGHGHGGKNGNDIGASGDEDDGTDAEERPPHAIHLPTEHRDVDRSSEEPDSPNRSHSDSDRVRDSDSDSEGGSSTDDDQNFEPTTSYD
jgi:hypothetical protein